jgi:hypothetical protein
LDAVKANIYDIVAAKLWALKLAADTAITILRVDQVSLKKKCGRQGRNLILTIFDRSSCPSLLADQKLLSNKATGTKIKGLAD